MMLSTCACTETSRAEVGSSQTRNSGSVASARAIEIRCRCPPENWCGNFSASAAASPTELSSSATRSASWRSFAAPERPSAKPCSRKGSATMSCTFQRGLRLAYGSWKIICIRRRTAFGRPSPVVSMPSKTTRPRVGAYSPTSSRATVLLPQPDSPTSASVVPRAMLKATSSTAWTNCRGLRSTTRLSQGAETSKVFARPSTSTSGETFVSSTALMPPPAAARHAASTPPAWRRRAGDPAARPGSDRRPAGSAD